MLTRKRIVILSLKKLAYYFLLSATVFKITPPTVATIPATLTTLFAIFSACSAFLPIIVLFNVIQCLFFNLVQLFKFKIIWIAACFLIVESIDAHVGFLHLLGSIVKRGDGVLHGCYCHYHFGSENCAIRALDALRLYLKYSTHKHSFLSSLYMAAPAFQPEQLVVYFQGAKIRKFCEPNKSIMVHK